jgi:hypothetical protein
MGLKRVEIWFTKAFIPQTNNISLAIPPYFYTIYFDPFWKLSSEISKMRLMIIKIRQELVNCTNVSFYDKDVSWCVLVMCRSEFASSVIK